VIGTGSSVRSEGVGVSDRPVAAVTAYASLSLSIRVNPRQSVVCIGERYRPRGAGSPGGPGMGGSDTSGPGPSGDSVSSWLSSGSGLSDSGLSGVVAGDSTAAQSVMPEGGTHAITGWVCCQTASRGECGAGRGCMRSHGDKSAEVHCVLNLKTRLPAYAPGTSGTRTPRPHRSPLCVGASEVPSQKGNPVSASQVAVCRSAGPSEVVTVASVMVTGIWRELKKVEQCSPAESGPQADPMMGPSRVGPPTLITPGGAGGPFPEPRSSPDPASGEAASP